MIFYFLLLWQWFAACHAVSTMNYKWNFFFLNNVLRDKTLKRKMNVKQADADEVIYKYKDPCENLITDKCLCVSPLHSTHGRLIVLCIKSWNEIGRSNLIVGAKVSEWPPQIRQLLKTPPLGRWRCLALSLTNKALFMYFANKASDLKSCILLKWLRLRQTVFTEEFKSLGHWYVVC